MAVINIDSDQEPNIPTEQGLCLQSDLSPSVLPNGTTIVEEDEIVDEGYDPLKTPKRKRALTVVISDDEFEETEVIPKRRALNIENSDNEGEENKDDDALVKAPKRKCDLKVATSSDQLEENEVTPMRRALKIGNSYNEGEEGKDDDDALVKTPKRKSDLRVVTSDDELEEIEVIPKRRALKIENSDNEGEEDKDDDDDDALPIRQIFNRAKLHSQSDDEDNIPISQLVMNRGHGSRSDDCPSVSCPKRRLVKCGQSANIDRNWEMKFFPDSIAKKYIEHEDDEDENESESDDSLRDFIVDDTRHEDLVADLEDDLEDDLSEDSNRHSDEPEEESDDNLGFIISRLQRRKDPNSEWELLADMLSDFGKDPELCMRGVCAIYRRQRTKEQSWVEGDDQRGIGFNKFDVGRGAILADFLTDGNPEGKVVKTVEELEDYDPEGPEVCRTLAGRYSNQLFEIYKNEEDPFFP